MKTKTFLLICLFLGIGLTQLSAQNGKNGTGADPYSFVWDGYYVDVPVNCGDATVDRLSGIANLHLIDHYMGGVLIGHTISYRGEVKSLLTNEIFALKDFYKWDATNPIGYGHCNLTGNGGTHYILSYSYNQNTDEFTFLKAVCP